MRSRKVAKSGIAGECGWLGRHLVRAEGPEGQGKQLGADQHEWMFEVLFHFYGPEKPVFDKTWGLPDIERVAFQ
jgi:hypothetical protein